jgi:arsenical pump membrane protein
VAVGGFVLLGAGVAGAIARPWRVPVWLAPSVAVLVALAVGLVDVHGARRAIDPLVEPLAFLLLAVPLAALLDHVGFFEEIATIAASRRHVIGGMWLLGIVTVAVLNLDAAVVLLTPLAIRTARRCGIDPLVLALQPVLLACLASSFLPVSNLTNLIVAGHGRFGVEDFVAHLGLPSVVALVVAWWCYRRAYPSARGVPVAADATRAPDRVALVTGTVVVAVLLAGFTVGPRFGVQPWMVVAAVDVVLVLRRRRVPIDAVPWGTALVAAALAVLAAAAVAHASFDGLLHGSGALAAARVTGVAAVGANVINNLPALLVGLARLPHGSPLLWPLLLGVNAGPTLLVTGSLASLLWLDAVRRGGLGLGARDYARLGVRVGLPALVAATVVLSAGAEGALWSWVATVVVLAVGAALVASSRRSPAWQEGHQ